MEEQNYQQDTYSNTPQPLLPPETVPPLPPLPEPPKEKPSRKKIALIVGLLLLVFIAAGMLWYFVTQTKNTSTVSTGTQEQIKDTTPEPPVITPASIIYARSDGLNAPYKLYAHSATAEDNPVEALTLPRGVSIPYSTIYKNQVAFVATSGGATNDKEAIYYSNDSGKSYKKIYTDPVEQAPTTLGTQITSIIFSSDGKNLLVGILPSPGDDNQVTEISLEGDNPTKILFTVDKAGVFLRAYDKTNSKVVYTSGCYNCDGGPSSELYVYDIATKKQETVYSTENRVLASAVNGDATKLLVAEGTRNPTPENPSDTIIAPYTLTQIDIGTKAKEVLATMDEGMILHVGYTPEGTPYVVTNKRIMTVVDKKLTTLFETSGIITSAQNGFIGASSVVVSAQQSSDKSDFTTTYIKAGTTESSAVLKGDANTIPLGITY